MTRLERRIVRIVSRPKRNLVVTLFPAAGEGLDPTIEVRESRARTGYRVTISALFMILAQRAADNRIAERRALRHQRKRLRRLPK